MFGHDAFGRRSNNDDAVGRNVNDEVQIHAHDRGHGDQPQAILYGCGDSLVRDQYLRIGGCEEVYFRSDQGEARG